MRLTKVLGEDRASASEPEGHSENAISLLEIFNCRISLSTHQVWISKDSSRVEGVSKQGFTTKFGLRQTYLLEKILLVRLWSSYLKVWRQTRTNVQNHSIRPSEPYTTGGGVFACLSTSIS